MWSPRLSAVALLRVPGPAGGAGVVGPAGVVPESGSVRSAVPALSPPAGLPAAQRPAGTAPPIPLQRGVQVCAQPVFYLQSLKQSNHELRMRSRRVEG